MSKFTRRDFIKRTAVAGAAATLLPRVALPFGQSPAGIRKFIVTLPGLGKKQANNMGNYIDVLTPDRVTYPGTDYYKIFARQFTQQIHPDIPATTFWGYAKNKLDQPTYPGGAIVMTKGRNVKLQVTNLLPHDHIVPVDWTAMDATLCSAFTGRNDRIAIHLHGGFVNWISDGGPFSWFSSATRLSKTNKNTDFVHGASFMNMVDEGVAVYDYPSGHSAQMLWYHDHAYGITRQNAYAGLATAFLITDAVEQWLIASGAIPNLGPAYPLGIPLVIQDKSFYDPDKDPNYTTAVPQAQKGWLWYPWQYESQGSNPPLYYPNQQLDATPTAPGWDPVAQQWVCMSYTCPAVDPTLGAPKARWDNGIGPSGHVPSVSLVAESFGDIMLVNGAPYPVLPVKPARYRFRILNPSQARFLNLMLFVADATPNGITHVTTDIARPTMPKETDPNNNTILTPNNADGAAFIQIANESGFLKAPAVFANTDPITGQYVNTNSNNFMVFNPGQMLYDANGKLVVDASGNPFDPTTGNAMQYNMVLAPAERADIIIDFRGFQGKKLILYTDAPAPFPGGDVRNDYYPGDADLTCIGGALSTPLDKAVGPDTRTIMRFDVSNDPDSTEPSFAQTLAMLSDPNTGLPAAFAASQEAPPAWETIPTTDYKVKSLNEDFDLYGRLRQRLGTNAVTGPSSSPGVNGYGVDLLSMPTEIAKAGETQVWDIYNCTGDTHPMHFHLVDTVVIGRQPYLDDGTGNFQLIGTMTGPDANENGFKETVRMNPGTMTRVAMRFDVPADFASIVNSPRLQSSYGIAGAEYVWHCHILDHEEHDMMHALVVTKS